ILNLSILRSQLFQLLGKGQPKCERMLPGPSLGLLELRCSQLSSRRRLLLRVVLVTTSVGRKGPQSLSALHSPYGGPYGRSKRTARSMFPPYSGQTKTGQANLDLVGSPLARRAPDLEKLIKAASAAASPATAFFRSERSVTTQRVL